jgi:hypothetical protein
MSDDTVCLPLLEAIEYAEAHLGPHGWTWMKRWQQAGRLPMCGFADGEKKLFQPGWLDYTARFVTSDPQPLDSTASQADFSIPSVGPRATIDRPRRTILSDEIAALVRDLPPPIPKGLPTNDDVLYFDVPIDLRGKVPQRVTRIQVDAERLHALITKQTQPEPDLLPAFETEEIRARQVPAPAVDLQGKAPSPRTSALAKPPFAPVQAAALLIANYAGCRPTGKAATAFLVQHFSGVPRPTAMRALMNDLNDQWGPAKRGKPPANKRTKDPMISEV